MFTRLKSATLSLSSALLLTCMFMGAVPSTANAQSNSWSEFFPDLSKKDYALVEAKVRKEMTGKPVGTILVWTNPESGNSGSVQLVSTYQWEGHECRRLVHFLKLKRDRHQSWEVAACKIGDEWKWPVPPRKL